MFWRIKSFFESFFDYFLISIGKHSNGLPQKILHNLNIKLPSREQIPLLVNSFNLRGESAEIGVFEGKFSELLLSQTKLEKLHCIDPWFYYSDNAYHDLANEEQKIQDQRFKYTKERLKRFERRVNVIRSTSKEASPKFEDNSLDFVYIDANHSYEACYEDLSLWWNKLKKDGLIAGDDYTDQIDKSNYGVKSAVNNFFKEKNIKVYTTYKKISIHWPNWYVIKY